MQSSVFHGLCFTCYRLRFTFGYFAIEGRGATWAAHFLQAAAEWVLMRDRIIEEQSIRSFDADIQTSYAFPGQLEEVPTVAVTRTGGPQRAFMVTYLQEHGPGAEDQSALFTAANKAYRSLKRQGGPEWDALVKRGQLATESGRLGGITFCTQRAMQGRRGSSSSAIAGPGMGRALVALSPDDDVSSELQQAIQEIDRSAKAEADKKRAAQRDRKAVVQTWTTAASSKQVGHVPPMVQAEPVPYLADACNATFHGLPRLRTWPSISWKMPARP